MKNILFIVLLGFIFSACGKYSDKEKDAFDQQIAAYVKKNNLQMTKSESGLYYVIHEEGEGDFIKPNAIISTTYTGKLLDGKLFDNQKVPVEFQLNKLVDGWREIAHYLKPGGRAAMIVPPQIGYGAQKLEDIPANSILIFELKIEDVY